jgi:hypothetical protein
MKYLFLLSALLLSSCNSFDAVDAASRTIEPLSSIVNYDTNGFYTKNTKPHQKVCEYRISQYRIEWRPCK